MYKITSFARLSRDLGRDEAVRYWRESHSSLVNAVPGLTGYVQNRLLVPPPGVMGPPPARPGGSEKQHLFDVISCLWFADQPTFELAMSTPEWSAVIADAPNFLDMHTVVTVPVEERVIKDGEHAAFKEV